jgi:uncharacterized protein
VSFKSGPGPVTFPSAACLPERVLHRVVDLTPTAACHGQVGNMTKAPEKTTRPSARIVFELATVLLFGIAKFVVGDALGHQFGFVTVGCAAWAAFIAVRSIRHPFLAEEWGFTRNNFGASVKMLWPFAVLSMLGFFLYGARMGHAVIPWHLGAVFFLYPVWGLVQQFLVAALLAGNLDSLLEGKMPRWAVVVATAALFALVHLPSPPLALAAFALGCVNTAVFLRYRNIWAIGIFHGWFATFLYFFFLGQDPLHDLFY